jgi:putative DNA-invertase from lambdoid prophage Rac
MRVCIYSRVSTSRQDTENQTLSLREWAKQRGWEIVKIYEEYESAWKAGHQAELAQLKVDAARRKFEIVLVWALDRLSREGALAILSLVSRLKTYGVKVVSYQESWTEAPGELAEILYAITGWVARMESQRRSDRTKAGLVRVLAQGQKLGRPKGSRDKRKRRKRRIF